MKTFKNYLNENKIADAIQTAIESWYSGSNEGIEALTQLLGLDEETVVDILNNSTVETAMENLINFD